MRTEHGTPTNAERAEWARAALESYSGECGPPTDHDEDCQDAIADLICNLGHYATLRGFDYLELIKRGAGMFSAEHRHPDGNPYMNDTAEIMITLCNNRGE